MFCLSVGLLFCYSDKPLLRSLSLQSRHASVMCAWVGQNHKNIWCIYDIFGREIAKYTVMYSVYIRFWPTLDTTPIVEQVTLSVLAFETFC